MAETSWSPSSSHIAQVTFDDATDTLTIEFVDGNQYDYMNVPASVSRDFRNASSAGQFFNRQIKSRYAYEAR